jgi:hypothetical protein
MSMKLYYIPESCALAAHIVANEAEIPVAAVRVDLRTKKTASGAGFNHFENPASLRGKSRAIQKI